MWPRPWHRVFLSGQVPLAVLDEEVVRQEEQGKRQKEEEAVVKVAINDAVFGTVIPGHGNDFRVKREWYAKACQKDVSDGQVHEQVVSGCPRPFGAQASDNK